MKTKNISFVIKKEEELPSAWGKNLALFKQAVKNLKVGYSFRIYKEDVTYSSAIKNLSDIKNLFPKFKLRSKMTKDDNGNYLYLTICRIK